MRSYNAAAVPRKRLHFAGLDAQAFAAAAESVRRFSAAHDAALGKAVAEHYACILPSLDALMRPFPDSAVRGCVQRVRHVAALIAPLRPNADVAHDARLVEQFVHVRLELAHDSRGGESSVIEAENVEWLSQTRFPDAKVAVWSTNREVGSRLDAVPELRAGSRGTLGSSLARRFGASYAAIGFAFDRGSATVRGANGIRAAQVAPAPDGTTESVLRDAGDRFYLSLRSLPRNDPLGIWLGGETLNREISAFFFMETSAGLVYTDAVERKRFDALIFIAQSRPTSAFSGVRPPSGDWFPTPEGSFAISFGGFRPVHPSPRPR